MPAKFFLDTNVILYLLSRDTSKSEIAERLLHRRPTISVQVLNEVANVARRKMNLSWAEVHELLESLRALCEIEPITSANQALAMTLAERYGLSIYDAQIVANACTANCTLLYSEDMQDRLRITPKLTIRNPFVAATPKKMR